MGTLETRKARFRRQPLLHVLLGHFNRLLFLPAGNTCDAGVYELVNSCLRRDCGLGLGFLFPAWP